jgi:hypothetical protein
MNPLDELKKKLDSLEKEVFDKMFQCATSRDYVSALENKNWHNCILQIQLMIRDVERKPK